MSTLDELLALEGKTRADVPLRGDMGAFLRADGVGHDAALDRVLALPRRQPATEHEIEALSAYLRKREYNDDGERNLLRTAQVEALRELFEVRGLFAPMRVGSGKTLVTLLAATLLQSTTPVLMVPASLQDKTRREFAAYHKNWHVRLPKLISYSLLGHPDHEDDLLHEKPDLLLLDEVHKARNLDAAVTRRIKRAIEAFRPVVAVLSGTLITEKIMDYHHQSLWSLDQAAPLPLQPADAERWGQAIDKDVGALKRISEGALASLPGGFHEWQRGSRGVIPTPGSECDASILMRVWAPELPEPLREIIHQVGVSKLRPDSTEADPILLDEWELPDCQSQLALEFFYAWDPMPPEWWLRPRKAWRAYVQAVLEEHLDGFDSPSQIVRALDRSVPHTVEVPVYDGMVDTHDGLVPNCVGFREEVRPGLPPGRLPPMPDEGRQLLAAWREVRNQFTPNPVPVWWDEHTSAWTKPGEDPIAPPSVLRDAIRHAGSGTLIWVRHRAVGFQLERMGVPYYPGGTDPETAKPGETIALSIDAHGTGRNLQAWHKSLYTSAMANADAWEQGMGRTHRAGQKADTVEVWAPGIIDYHGAVLGRVLAEARAITKASGFTHKLVAADWA